MPVNASSSSASPSEEQSDISVFAPWPLFTVTIECLASGGDEVYFHAGGQAVWVARMVTGLERNVTLVGPFGGETKHMLEALVQAEGIGLRSVAVKGANGGYVNDRRSGTREEVASVTPPCLNRHEIDDLFNATLAEGIRCGTAVVTGIPDGEVLPVEFFGRLVKDLRANGVKVVADVAGTVLDAIEEGLTVLRASYDDLEAASLVMDDNRDELIKAISKLQHKADNIVVSRAGSGSFALWDGELLEVKGPEISARDNTGGGDSMTAALAVAISAGMSGADALRLASAAAALNLTRHGRGTGKLKDIEVLARQVEILEVAS